MFNNAMIYNELKELNSLLANISNKNIFRVPDHYFDSLSADILHGIYNKDLNLGTPVLNSQVPEGYFDGLAGQIMNKIKANNISPGDSNLLNSIGNRNIFKVPANYFENVATNILQEISSPPEKVIVLSPRNSFFKYAVAAAVTGIIGLSLFSIFNKKNESKHSSAFSFISPDKVNEILQNNNFDQVMESLGEDEIINYLKSEGEDVNTALVASLTDEQTLPKEDAYFIDEKVLDNFLNENIGESAGKSN